VTERLVAHGSWPLPFWIAHRGAGKLAPENTLAAFRVGASHGWQAFECDVKLSADGVPFLLHDATLDRTTDASGTAGDLPWSELSRIDAGSWHGPAFAGEPLATLEALAAWLCDNGFALDLEIKPTPGSERHTGEVVGRVATRLWSGSQAPPLAFSSFRPEALLGARATAPHVPRALLLDEAWQGWLEVANELGCVAIITNHRIMDAAMLSKIHAAGMRGLVYTVNDPDTARSLRAMGVDGIVTDAVDRFDPGSRPA
jgi:glycerophosphoryl diester phosphodiesterase